MNVTVSTKIRNNPGQYDVMLEWDEDDPQLRVALMNLCPGQFTYHGNTAFSFVAPAEFDLEEFKKRVDYFLPSWCNRKTQMA